MENIQTYILVNWKELIAAFFGFLYVFLAAKENKFCWFAGIVNVIFYLIIFYEQKIYANMTLQFIYLIISIYGLYNWNRKNNGVEIKITRIEKTYLYFILVLFIICVGIFYLSLEKTDSDYLLLDATTAAAGIFATWMQARKFLENWLIWIPTDIILTILFFYEKLYVTSVLFFIYTIIAVFAYLKWKKSFNSQIINN